MAEATPTHPRLKEILPEAARILYNEVDVDEIQPLGARVLCKPIEEDMIEEVEGSDLFVVRDNKDKPRFNLVLRTGPGRLSKETGEREPMPVSPGDLLVTGGYVGHPVEWGRENFRMIHVGDILGVYKGDYEADE